jgi:DNA-binding response OmpR family regulator
MAASSPEPCRILLADDDADVRTTLKLVLDMENHAVSEACDGQQALNLFQPGHFDLVITDYIMPEMSGDQLAVEIKKQDPTVPVIMITANADRLPNVLPGVDILLPKPFQIAELRQAVRRMARARTTKQADPTA